MNYKIYQFLHLLDCIFLGALFFKQHVQFSLCCGLHVHRLLLYPQLP